MRDIKDYKLHSTKEAKYIPILDYDPSLAASYLTRKDSIKAYELLKEVYEDIREGNIKTPLKSETFNRGDEYCGYARNPLLSDTVLGGAENFRWWAIFTRALEEIIGEETEIQIPYSMSPKETEDDTLWFFNPFYATCFNNRVLRYEGTNNPNGIPINNYRILYIKNRYELADFYGCKFPGWYLLGETTLFEDYNEKTNVRVKITFEGGSLKYYTAGSSDNWQQVKDVPKEMDSVVSAFMFRNLV